MSRIKAAAVMAFVTLVPAAPMAVAGGYIAPVVAPVIPAPVVAAPGAWAGPYAGLTLGYAVAGKERVGFSDLSDAYLGDVGDVDLTGLTGGVRIGYRWQRDAWVFGPELGFEVGNVDDTLDFSNQTGAGSVTSEVRSVMALRVKAGRQINEDTLLYGIVGIAHGRFAYEVDATSIGSVSPVNGSAKYDHTGFVVGLGVERRLSDRLSLTGEWEYAEFGKTDLEIAGTVTRATPKYHQIRLGANYRF